MLLMGKVWMTEAAPHTPGIYYQEDFYSYTYCDRCGSFNIGIEYLQSRPETNIQIATLGVFASVGVIIVAVVSAFYWAIICVVGIIGLTALVIRTPDRFLKCRKCGNENITDFNVLNYSDSTVVDVPIDSIIKEYIGSRFE